MRLFGTRAGKLRFPLDIETLREKPRNDAEHYGVIIQPVRVTEGKPFWQVLHVHHLTPEENRGDRALYIEVLDEEGRRVPNVTVRIRGPKGEVTQTLISDPKKPGLRVEMDKWSFYEVEVKGLPSERVIGLSAAHPREGRGNPEGRHSFLIVWQRTRRAVTRPIEPPEEEARESAEEVTPPIPPTQVEAPTPVEEPRAEGHEEVPVVEKEPPKEAHPKAEEGAAAAVMASPVPAPPVEEAPEERPAETEGTPVLGEAQPEVSPEAEVEEPTPTIPSAESAGPEEPQAEEPSEESGPVTPAVEEIPPEEEVLSPEGGPREVEEPPGELPVEAGEEMLTSAAEAEDGVFLPLFVLFADGHADTSMAAFFVVMEHLRAAGVPFGFDAWDAAQHARRVVVIGSDVPQALKTLEAQGIEVQYIPATSPTLVHDLEHALGVG